MNNLSKIETVKQLQQNFSSVTNTNIVHHNKLTPQDKLALFVTEKIGTIGFFFIIFIWTFVWLGWNVLAPPSIRFDPYPAFVLWLFISNLIQIHLMPLIMVGQNIQGKHAQLRAEHDFETDRKAEREIETILLHLENQQRLILKILEKIEKLEKSPLRVN